MKLKLVTFILLFLCCYNLPAKEIEVTPSTYVDVFNNAEDGTVLLLETGNYSTKLQFPSGKTITLKAAEGASPIFKADIQSSNTADDGGLIFDGVDIDRGNASNFIDITMKNIREITFRNLTISNINRCLIVSKKVDAINYINKIEISNCIIKECGKGTYNFMWPQHSVKAVLVQNSTLYNYNSGESFFCPNASDTENVLNFTFENNTVYNWSGTTSGRALAKVVNEKYSGEYSSTSTYTFKNNIVAEHTGSNLPSMAHVASGTVSAQNNLIVNYGGYIGGTQTISDLSLASLGLTAIGFTDPTNENFTILSTSPIATAATNGGIIGDPRWLKSVGTDAVALTTSVYPEGTGQATPVTGMFNKGESVQVSATGNYGYRFKEWQKNGQQVSVENPYTFLIEEKSDLVAVFNTIDTYTLTINKEGDGARWGNVKLNPQPINGKYEKNEIVTVTITPNDVAPFLYWEDGGSQYTREIVMEGDKTLIATFDQINFIVGWSFDPSEPRSARPGDYYSRTDNTGIMKFYNANGSSTNWGGSSKTYNGITYAAARRYTGVTDMNNPRYFQAEFSTKIADEITYKNIRVSSYIAVDNECVHKIQKMQYATNESGPYTDFASIDLTPYYNTQWVEFSGILPELNNEEKGKIYIRWIGDTNSALFGSPADGATEGFYLANVIVYAEEDDILDPTAPALISTTPAEGSNTASKDGSIVLTFNKKVKAGNNEGKIELNGELLTPVFGNKTVSYPYSKLTYGAQHSFTIPNGAIVNKDGVPFGGKTITFSTRVKPEPVLRLYDAVVDINGKGNYTKLQDAINAAPNNRTRPWLIFIKNGRYEEIIRVPKEKPFIHLIGQDKESVTITYCIHCGDISDPCSSAALGITDQCTVVGIYGSDFYAENISFENTHGVEAQSGPQALAIRTEGDRASFFNCKFRSFQDTWLTSSNADARLYATNSWIEGAVDYIYGGGNAYIENTTLFNVRDGYIVAPAHQANIAWGYVFNNCVIDGTESITGMKLGRPWHNNPTTVFLNTTMKCKVHPEGWNGWNTIPKLFAEYNSVDGNGNPIDLSLRKTCYSTGKVENGDYVEQCGLKAVLSHEEAARYSYDNILSGSDDWHPKAFFESVDKPANLVINQNGKLSWNPSQYAICYIIYEGNSVIGFTTSTSYEVVSNTIGNIYTIRPVNEFGSLGEMSDVAKPDMTSIDSDDSKGNNPVIEKSDKGILIKNIEVGIIISIYSIDGRFIDQKKSDSDYIFIPNVTLRGMYLIKVKDSTFKVVL